MVGSTSMLPILITLLLTAQFPLANGINVVSLPPSNDTFEVSAGYRAGVRDETAGTSGLAAAVSAFLYSSTAVRSLALAVYGAGGEFEFFSDLDRTGFHLKVPIWAKPGMQEQLAEFFATTPQGDLTSADRALTDATQRADASDADFRLRVEDEIRRSLLGLHAYSHRPAGWKADLSQLSRKQLEGFFFDNYGTDRAFLLITGGPDSALERVPARRSHPSTPPRNDVFKAERSLRFPTAPPSGAVIFASPVPSVYYRGWYAVLLLDRLIQRIVPSKPIGAIIPALDPYYYRIEISVADGQFVDTVQDNFVHELERLQYVRAPDRDFQEARASAVAYLESPAIQQWFLSMGIPERRLEGIDWIQSFSSDEMRATARDLLLANRVIASWAAKPKETSVAVESLNSAPSKKVSSSKPISEMPPVRVPPFPAHADSSPIQRPAEQLSSGVSVVASSVHAIFVAPDTLRVFSREPTFEMMQSLGAYRASRILVMSPPADIEHVKQQWSLFLGNASDSAKTDPAGPVSSTDLGALVVLKTVLDRKLIEAGLWQDVQLAIRANTGSQLSIEAEDHNRTRVLGWIEEIAAQGLSEGEMTWAREAAVHQLNRVLPDVQSLLWQRDPQAAFPDLPTVSGPHVQAIARTYF